MLENSKELSIEKNLLLVSDFFNYNFNDKKILSALYKDIGTNIIKDEKQEQLDSITEQVLLLLGEYLDEYSYLFTMNDRLEVADYSKALALKIDIEMLNSYVERIMALVDIIADFSVCKAIVFVNVKCYFNREQLEEIYKYILHRQVSVLFVETIRDEAEITYERKLVIDEDYYEEIK